MIDLTTIAGATITVILAIISGFLVPYIKQKTTAAQQERICFWATIAVDAAEKILEDQPGKSKFEYVKNILLSKGFTLDENEVQIIIEQALRELKRKETGIA